MNTNIMIEAAKQAEERGRKEAGEALILFKIRVLAALVAEPQLSLPAFQLRQELSEELQYK